MSLSCCGNGLEQVPEAPRASSMQWALHVCFHCVMKKKGQEPVQAQPFSNHPDKSGLGVTLPRPRSCSAPPLCSRQGGTHAPGVRRPLASGGFPSEQSRGLCSGGDAGLWGRGCVATRQRPPSPQAWFGCLASLHWAIQAGGKGALGSVGSQRPAASSQQGQRQVSLGWSHSERQGHVHPGVWLHAEQALVSGLLLHAFCRTPGALCHFMI